MSQFIICNKDNKGIIAEVVGNMLKIQKRKNDFHPFQMTLMGNDWDTNISCTGCGEVHHIECVNGKLNLEGLTLREKEQLNVEDDQEGGPTGSNGATGSSNNNSSTNGPSGSSGPRSYIKRPGTFARQSGSNSSVGGASGATGPTNPEA